MYYLGTITGASGAYSNQATGLSGIGAFQVPPNIKALYLFPSATGILFELGTSTGFQTTAARGAYLLYSQAAGGGVILNGPFRCTGPTVTVSIYRTAAGFESVRVYATPTS